MQEEHEFSFTSLFIPFTSFKAIQWIIGIGLVVYFNSLFNGFVWDDAIYIVNNIDIKTLNLFYLFGPNTWNNGLYYRPLASVYYSTLYALFNYNAFFYHLFQITFHITNCVLLFLIFSKFFKKKNAFFLSLIFLVHPIQVESTVFISTTLTPLALLFGLAALLLSFKQTLSLRRILFISMLLFVSLLVRETGLLSFGFVLLYRLILKFKLKEIITMLSIDILLALLYLILRFEVGHVFFNAVNTGIVPIAKLTLLERLINIPAMIFYYFKTLVFPLNLAIDQQWVVKSLNIVSFYSPLLIDLLLLSFVAFLGIFIFRRNQQAFKIYIFFFSWFLVSLVFHLQLFPLDMTVADRFFYFPMVGLLGMVGIAISQMNEKKNYSGVFNLGIIILIIIFSLITISRNKNWYNGLTLYTHDLKNYDSSNIEIDLGDVYESQQNYVQALIHYKKSASILPTELNMYNIGYAYQALGNFQNARKYYINALNFHAYPIDQHRKIILTISQQLGWTYIHLKEYKTAKTFLTSQLAIFPKDAYLWKYLAMSDEMIGDHNEALFAAGKAKALISGEQANTYLIQVFDNQLKMLFQQNTLMK